MSVSVHLQNRYDGIEDAAVRHRAEPRHSLVSAAAPGEAAAGLQIPALRAYKPLNVQFDPELPFFVLRSPTHDASKQIRTSSRRILAFSNNRRSYFFYFFW